MSDQNPPGPRGPEDPYRWSPGEPGSPGSPPAGVPTSPTGRVPQWALDEAAGRPVAPVPFRSWEPPSTSAPRRRRRFAPVVLLLVAATVAALLWTTRAQPAPVAAPVPVPTVTASGEPTAPDTPAPTPSPTDRPDSAGPVPGFEETPRPASLPEADLRKRSGAGFVFTSFQRDKRTGVTWSPCRPLHYVLRGSSRAPVEGARMLRDAVARVSALTGLDIEYDGTTKEKYSDRRDAYQPKRYGQRWAPVLVSWSTTKEDPGLRGDVLGRAGAQWVATDSGDRAYVSGTVSLDTVQIERVRRTYGYEVARSVVMHELGHLMGLGHVASRTSLMNPSINPQVTDFSAADRRGLQLLGEGPCQPDA